MPCQQTVIRGSDIFDEDYLIQMTKVIGTHTVVFTAWRPDPLQEDEGGRFHRCGTICYEEERWWGRIGTGPDNSKFAGMPVGDERTRAVQAAYNVEYQLAYQLILSVHPEVRSGKHDMGEIRIHEESVRCMFSNE